MGVIHVFISLALSSLDYSHKWARSIREKSDNFDKMSYGLRQRTSCNTVEFGMCSTTALWTGWEQIKILSVGCNV